MKEFQGRRRLRHLLYSKATIVFLLLLVVLMSRALWGVYQKNSLAAAGRDQAAASLLELEEQKEQLEARVSWLATPRGQEEEIRKNFSVVKPGEGLIVVVDAVASTSDLGDGARGQSWWRRLGNTIKGWWAN